MTSFEHVEDRNGILAYERGAGDEQDAVDYAEGGDGLGDLGVEALGDEVCGFRGEGHHYAEVDYFE